MAEPADSFDGPHVDDTANVLSLGPPSTFRLSTVIEDVLGELEDREQRESAILDRLSASETVRRRDEFIACRGYWHTSRPTQTAPSRVVPGKVSNDRQSIRSRGMGTDLPSEVGLRQLRISHD